MIPWLVLGASLPFVALLVARPVVRRLAARSLARRPVEMALVVVGSMLATAMLTGSVLVGDTVDRSIRAQAYDQLGPIDEVVAVSGLDAGEGLFAALDGFTHPDVDGVLEMVVAQAAVLGRGDEPLVRPTAQLIEVDFHAAGRFGDDPRATGISGPTPEPGEAAITEDLAAEVRVGPGDRITVFAYGGSVDLVVDRVLPRTGVAGFWPRPGQTSHNVFVAPGTVAGLVDGADGTEPPTALVAVSNVGDVEGGVGRTDAVVAALEEAVGSLEAGVRPAKQELLDIADELGGALGELYFTVGMFAVVAGILLLVNLFVMLADERRHELGMLRALGLRRAPLVAQFATEGWLYALVSAAAGAIAGIGMGWLITERSEAILSSGREIDRLRLDFAFDPSSVALGFALGFLISLVTIVVTSTRIARLNVIRAIRDLPEPTGRHPRRRWGALAVVAVGAGTAWGVAGLVGPDPYGAMVGPVLAASGAAALAWRRWPSSWVVGVTGPAVLAWTVAVVPLLGALDVDYDVPIFLVQGLILVAAAVATVMVHQASIGRLVARASGGSQAVRLGLAYPLARRFRTAMTLAMIAIVVLTLAYISVLSHLFHGQTDEMAAEQSPTFEVVVQSNPANPVPMTELAAVPGVDAVAPLVHGAAEFQRLGHDPVTWPVTGFDAELLAGPPTLIDLGGHPDAATAWRAVLDDPSLTIVDEIFLVTTIGPPGDLVEVGEVVTMTDPVSGRSHDLTVTALASSDYVTNGAYVTRDAVAMVFDRAVASRAMVSAADPDAVAERIRTSFVPHGVVADTVTDQVEALMALSTGFFTLMQQFVGIGLIVGMAGIAVIMVRAVRERRREIGVLRSLGLPAPSVARAFVVEAGFVAVEGVTIGLLTAIVASYGVVRSGASWAEQLEWSLPVGELAVIVAVALGSALLAAAGPARAAARTRPAVALRLAE